MQDYIVKRIIKESEFIINTGATVRQTAKKYSVGKSTVHKDVTVRLKKLDEELFKKVKVVLNKNLCERHIRGGEATKKKYLLKK